MIETEGRHDREVMAMDRWGEKNGRIGIFYQCDFLFVQTGYRAFFCGRTEARLNKGSPVRSRRRRATVMCVVVLMIHCQKREGNATEKHEPGDLQKTMGRITDADSGQSRYDRICLCCWRIYYGKRWTEKLF